MKTLQVNIPTGKSQFTLDAVRAVHAVAMDTLTDIKPEDAGKWLLVVELRPIKVIDNETKQVVDYCQQKEWLFDTREQIDQAVMVVDV